MRRRTIERLEIVETGGGCHGVGSWMEHGGSEDVG